MKEFNEFGKIILISTTLKEAKEIKEALSKEGFKSTVVYSINKHELQFVDWNKDILFIPGEPFDIGFEDMLYEMCKQNNIKYQITYFDTLLRQIKGGYYNDNK